MESVLRIAGRELPVHASLKTLIDYKSVFGTDLFEDLDKVQNVKEGSIGSLSGVVTVCFQIAYVLHRPYAKGKTFAEFLDEFEFDSFQSSESMAELTGVFSLLFPASRTQTKSAADGSPQAPGDH